MTDRQSNATIWRNGFRWGEIAGLITLVGLAAVFLTFSWRKWPDSLIDFGTELYTPWRLANGAVLYRDVDCFYGPLSKYFNALIFVLFKPGLMVLVAANLIVFATIVTTLYLLCRRAWGIHSALAACAIFIVVFGFSQFVGIGNYNYATPYSHEATHGLLLCLLLTFVLVRWVENATPLRSFLAGTLLGLTALLKPEILFAAALVTGVALFERCRSCRPSGFVIAAWAAGTLLPTAAFTAYFLNFFPFQEALASACRGWLNAVGSTRFTSDTIQIAFAGLDRPLKHFEEHALATLLACIVIGLTAGVVLFGEKIRSRWLSTILASALAGAMFWLARFVINWFEIGRCLLGLVLLYLLASALIPFFRTRTTAENRDIEITRRLIAILAAAMMVRMILAGRIYQYGFYQAALAAVILPAILIGELPTRLAHSRKGKTMLLVGVATLLLPGVVILCRDSVKHLHWKTLAIGQDRDRFYAFPEQIEPTGKIVSIISEALRKENKSRSLLVLPEGAMINYLVRLPSTVAPFIFVSYATEAGREEQIVLQLERRPPDLVVVISRDLREYGIQRYGERPGRGELLLRWMDENYNQIAHFGGDPFDYRERGAIILTHK